MKGILCLLLLPAWVFAQQPMLNAKAPTQESLNGLKNKLIQRLQSNQTAMEQAKHCLSAGKGQANFEKCYDQLPESMRQQIQSSLSPSQPLSYSADTQRRFIQILGSWILSSQTTVGCFEAARDVEQLKKCFGGGSADTSTNLDGNTGTLTDPAAGSEQDPAR